MLGDNTDTVLRFHVPREGRSVRSVCCVRITRHSGEPALQGLDVCEPRDISLSLEQFCRPSCVLATRRNVTDGERQLTSGRRPPLAGVRPLISTAHHQAEPDIKPGGDIDCPNGPLWAAIQRCSKASSDIDARVDEIGRHARLGPSESVHRDPL